MTLQIFREITFIPNVVGVIISFVVVGGGLMFPLGYLQNLSGTFYENYKEKGFLALKILKRVKFRPNWDQTPKYHPD